jgi:hypothetical protein
MDNLSAGIDASSGFFGRMYRLYGDLSSVAKLQSGVAESIGIGWRLPSESGGGINRNQVADCVGICKNLVFQEECGRKNVDFSGVNMKKVKSLLHEYLINPFMVAHPR